MVRSMGRLDRAAEARPWATGLAVGVPAGIVLAVAFALLDGEGFGDPGQLLARGVVQGLVIAVLVAGGGSWRRRWRADQGRAVEGDEPRAAEDAAAGDDRGGGDPGDGRGGGDTGNGRGGGGAGDGRGGQARGGRTDG